MWKYLIDMYAVPMGYYLVEGVAYAFVLIYEILGMNYNRFESIGSKPSMFAKSKNTFTLS